MVEKTRTGEEDRPEGSWEPGGTTQDFELTKLLLGEGPRAGTLRRMVFEELLQGAGGAECSVVGEGLRLPGCGAT